MDLLFPERCRCGAGSFFLCERFTGRSAALSVVVEFLPERGLEVSEKEETTGVPVFEALPLFRVDVDIDGGRGRPVLDSSRFIERSFVLELVRGSVSTLLSSPLIFFESLFDRVALSSSDSTCAPPLTCAIEVADWGRLAWLTVCDEFCLALVEVERAIGAPIAGLLAILPGGANVPTTGDEAIIGDSTFEFTVPALLACQLP